MNLYHLRYFVTLAHLEHYTKAAELLSITQPSLSHAISSLEKELGVRLFEKEGVLFWKMWSSPWRFWTPASTNCS